MDKVFEALERLAMPDELHIKECKKLGIGVTEDFDTVEKALLELKAIKEIEPSEALNELYRIENNIIYSLRDCDISEEVSMNFNSIMEHNSCAIIKNYILKAQEEHRALKTLKKNRIDIESLYTTFIDNAYNYKFYEISYGTYGKYKLTEEEFNLLKEVLE